MSTQTILIADGNTGRGQRVADALEVAGHPCQVAPHGAAGLEAALSEHPTVIVAQVGIAGSTTVGDGVALAGQVGIIGHLHIGDGARVAAQAGVSHDIPAGETWF